MKLSYLFAKFMQRLQGKAVIGSRIHPTAVIYSGSQIVNTSFGRYSYCSYNCKIVNAEIGAFCSISDHVYIGGEEHPMDWVSTSPVFQNVRHSGPTKRFSKFDVPSVRQTIIGSDVWIGHGATIKQGVTIGHGAVVGSNALVTKNVPPYAIVGGVPAKVIKYRFDEATIEALLHTEWWALPDEEIQQYAHLIQEPDKFIQQFKLVGIEKD